MQFLKQSKFKIDNSFKCSKLYNVHRIFLTYFGDLSYKTQYAEVREGRHQSHFGQFVSCFPKTIKLFFRGSFRALVENVHNASLSWLIFNFKYIVIIIEDITFFLESVYICKGFFLRTISSLMRPRVDM